MGRIFACCGKPSITIKSLSPSSKFNLFEGFFPTWKRFSPCSRFECSNCIGDLNIVSWLYWICFFCCFCATTCFCEQNGEWVGFEIYLIENWRSFIGIKNSNNHAEINHFSINYSEFCQQITTNEPVRSFRSLLLSRRSRRMNKKTFFKFVVVTIVPSIDLFSTWEVEDIV